MSLSRIPLYKELASLVGAYRRCQENGNEWGAKHLENIKYLVKNYMPSGCGIDSGTEIDLDASTEEKLVFSFSYHHMDDGGSYDGWTDHQLIVKASLCHSIDLKISGRDRNQIKEYLYETYRYSLTREVWRTREGEESQWHNEMYETQSIKTEDE